MCLPAAEQPVHRLGFAWSNCVVLVRNHALRRAAADDVQMTTVGPMFGQLSISLMMTRDDGPDYLRFRPRADLQIELV